MAAWNAGTILINCRAWQLFAHEHGIPYPGNFLSDSINIFPPPEQAGQLFKKRHKDLSAACADWGKRIVRIFRGWDKKPFLINPATDKSTTQQENYFTMSQNNQEIITLPQRLENIGVAPEVEDISWDNFMRSNEAMWVIHNPTQRVLNANPAAIAANANKPATEILNTEINVLWDDDPLNDLTKLVNESSKWLRLHSNVGWRWKRNEGEGGLIYMRQRTEFWVDYKKITYLGLENCRFEHVRAALPV